MNRAYKYPLSLEDEFVVEIRIEKRKVVDFKVMYNTIIDGKEHQVVRYDCSHGYAHKDILYKRPRRKKKMARLAYDKLFDLAKDDIIQNWEEYKRKYIKMICEYKGRK